MQIYLQQGGHPGDAALSSWAVILLVARSCLARAHSEGRTSCMSIAAKPEEGRHDVRGVLITKGVCPAGKTHATQLAVMSCNPNAVPLEGHFNE